MARHVLQYVTFSATLVLAACARVGAPPVPPERNEPDPWTKSVANRPQPDIRALLGRAPKLVVENLDVSLRGTDGWWYQEWVPNPDGKTYDLLKYYYQKYRGPHAVMIADLGSGQVRVDANALPSGYLTAGAGRAIAGDGKLYLASGGLKEMRIFCYDPTGNIFAATSMSVPVAGSSTTLFCAHDGTLYGAVHDPGASRARVFRIRPEKQELEELGPVGPEADYVLDLTAYDEYLYLVTRKNTWTLTACNLKTKEEKMLFRTLHGGRVFIGLSDCFKRYGTEARVTGLEGSVPEKLHCFWVFQGQATEHAEGSLDMPWKEREQREAAVPMPAVVSPQQPEIFKEKLTPDPQTGNAELWHRSSKDEEWKRQPFQVPLYPVKTQLLLPLPDGRLFVKAEFYYGESIFDPRSGRTERISRGTVAGASAMVLHENHVYLAGYSSARLWAFDLGRPFSFAGPPPDTEKPPQDRKLNPRYLAILRQYGDAHQINGGAAGADGKIFFAGHRYRSGDSGELCWWDPKTETGGSLWKPFSNFGVHYLTTVARGRYVVLSTSPTENTELGTPAPKQAKLMVFDVTQGKIVREIEPIENAAWTGMILGLDDRRLIGFTEKPGDPQTWILYGVDILTGRVLWRKPLPSPDEPGKVRPRTSQRGHRYDLFAGPDGKVYLWMQNRLIRIHPEDAFVEVLGEIGELGEFAFLGEDLYLAGTEAVRRVRAVTRLAGVTDGK
ncbi:MAG: PQQ-like beta-propeller repeat protein [Verrucomicrobia bacterium]|nr:PQQ-like beta-propeller repeat protein [Verrucomicrobiota bacterium]